ncbi:MAG: 2-amino-4-hydroxy-6-hydroxymethyldihydropteridine diphosphokinase [Cocleimonas sp.]
MTDIIADAVLCYVALGSNIGDAKQHFINAQQALKSHPDINKLKTSRFYSSKPHGPQDQPDYLNAVVSFETAMRAEELLDTLQNIENINGREREKTERWGARTLDLDILFYGDSVIQTTRLSIPHPRICERAFVVYPLADLVDDLNNLKINKTTSLQDCIDHLSDEERHNIETL